MNFVKNPFANLYLPKLKLKIICLIYLKKSLKISKNFYNFEANINYNCIFYSIIFCIKKNYIIFWNDDVNGKRKFLMQKSSKKG